MKKLLIHENDQLLLDGKKLHLLAIMERNTINSFFELSRIYLETIKTELSGEFSFDTYTRKKYYPNGLTEYTYVEELSVNDNDYEFVRRKLFELAYMKCSRVGKARFTSYGLKDAGTTDLIERIMDLDETYSCIYKDDNNTWTELRSETMILEEDKEKRYSLLDSEKTIFDVDKEKSHSLLLK